MLEHAMNHFIDLLRFSDVDLHRQRIEPGMPQVRGSLLQVFGTTAADREVRAELAHAFRDRQAETGAAPCDDRDLAFEQRRGEHRVRLPACESGCPRGKIG